MSSSMERNKEQPKDRDEKKHDKEEPGDSDKKPEDSHEKEPDDSHEKEPEDSHEKEPEDRDEEPWDSDEEPEDSHEKKPEESDKRESEDSDKKESEDSDENEPEEEEEAAASSQEQVAAGKKVCEENLWRMVFIAEYLCRGMAAAALSRKVKAGYDAANRNRKENPVEANVDPKEKLPEAPLVVLMNCCSYRRRDIMFKDMLQKIIKKDQVFDLSRIPPPIFVQYGLAFLESYGQVDDYARRIHKKLRVLVAGGNETVESVLKSMEEILQGKKRTPVGIIPLGIGNDLSRSIGWGSSIPSTNSAVRHFLVRAALNPVQALDSWHVDIIAQENGLEEPYSPLKLSGTYSVTKGDDIQKMLPENVSRFEGIFYCYFTVGVDAQVASAFCHQVNPIPHLDEGRISEKLTNARHGCSQGWFFTPWTKTTESRKLKDILSLYIKGVNKRKWKEILIPEGIKEIAFLNIDSYGGGRHPWGVPSPEYLEEKKFYEANSADGLMEIIGLKHGCCHDSLVMLKLISAKRIAQAAEIKLEFEGGAWKGAYMQMDGQAISMKLPASSEATTSNEATVVKIQRHRFQASVIRGKIEKPVKRSNRLG